MTRWEKTGSYGLYKIRYHDCIYLLLLGKRNSKSFEISFEKILLLEYKRFRLLNADY